MKKNNIPRRRYLKLLGASSAAGFAAPTAAQNKQMTAWAWGDSELEPIRSQQAKQFKEQTGITLNWQYFPWENYLSKLISSISANNAPATFAVGTDWVPQLGANDAVVQVNELGFDPQNFIKPARRNASYGGNVYAVPWYADIRLIAINKDMFKEAGLSVPSDQSTPPTWDEFANWVNTLADEHGKGFIVEPQETFESFFLSNGGRYLRKMENGKYRCTMDSPEVVETANYWLEDLDRNNNILATGDYDDAFRAGRAGIGYVGSWHYQSLQESDIDFMMMPIPKGPSGDSSHSWSAGVYYSVSPQSNQDLGKQWLDYIWSEDVQARVVEQTGGFPGRKSVYETEKFQNYLEGKPNLQVVAQEMEHGVATPRIQGLGKVLFESGSYASAAIDRVWQGQMSPEKSFAQACEQIVQNVDVVTK